VSENCDFISDQEDAQLCGAISKEIIDDLTGQIEKNERTVRERIVLKERFQALISIPGVGVILALPIMLETGEI